NDSAPRACPGVARIRVRGASRCRARRGETLRTPGDCIGVECSERLSVLEMAFSKLTTRTGLQVFLKSQSPRLIWKFDRDHEFPRRVLGGVHTRDCEAFQIHSQQVAILATLARCVYRKN